MHLPLLNAALNEGYSPFVVLTVMLALVWMLFARYGASHYAYHFEIDWKLQHGGALELSAHEITVESRQMFEHTIFH